MSALYFSIRKMYMVLPIFLACTALSAAAQKQADCTQGSTCVSINNGSDPMSAEQARQSKQQWNESKNIRNKKNAREEREFDKQSKAIDARDNCTQSANINVYWESKSERCLDRRTGKAVMP